MKREAVGHTKMKRLCRRLDLPSWQAVGLLESLWLLTGREAPRGDIGKLSDEDIALAIDFRGDETALMDGLIATGWVDRDPVERLVIHDWADHSDDAVHMRLARARQFFVGGRAPKLTRLAGKEREAAHEFYSSVRAVLPPCAQRTNTSTLPEPVPVPEPQPEEYLSVHRDGAGTSLQVVSDGSGRTSKPVTSRKADREVLENVARAIYGRHPNAFGRRDVGIGVVEKRLEAILKHKRIAVSEAAVYLRRIDANHTAACQSDAWRKDGGQYARSLQNYLVPKEERYDVEPSSESQNQATESLYVRWDPPEVVNA